MIFKLSLQIISLFIMSTVILCLKEYDYEVFGDSYDCKAKRDGFYGDPTDCSLYWRCNYELSSQFRCQEGTNWNDKEGKCDWADLVDCTRYDPTTTTTTTTSTTTTSTTTTTLEPPSTTTVMTITLSMMTTMTTEEVQETTTSKATSASTIDPSICTGAGIYFIGKSDDCSSYHLCQNGVGMTAQCPDNQLFNADNNRCETAELVNCGGRPNPLRPVVRPTQSVNPCSSKSDGVYPDLNRNCDYFYQCINQEKTREAICPRPLKFNLLTGRCDYSNLVLAPCGTYNPSQNSGNTISFGVSKYVIAIISIFIMFY